MRFDFESIVEPSVTANGCDLWGIDFIHGANTPILRVFIDAVGGATIEDCEKISKDLNYELPCLLYTSPSPRDATLSRMPSSA